MHVVSSASMNIFPENTLANFTNYFSEEVNLEGDWRVALSETIFPSRLINQVNTKHVTKFRGIQTS